MRSKIEKKIAANPSPFKASLEGMEIVDEEIKDIIEAIKTLKPDLKAISLDNNNISYKGAQILAKELTNFKELKQLSVQFNKIGEKGAVKLFGLKQVLPDLEILFNGNGIINASKMLEIERKAVANTSFKP